MSSFFQVHSNYRDSFNTVKKNKTKRVVFSQSNRVISLDLLTSCRRRNEQTRLIKSCVEYTLLAFPLLQKTN